MDTEVVVVGAGLAGLECARALTEHGIAVRVVEAADAVGGRVRSARVDGFTVDRGFQVLNPAYPAVRRHVDVDALDLRPMFPGVLVRREHRLAVLADPRRAPGYLPRTLASGYLDPRELLGLAAWTLPALGPVRRLLAEPDTSRAESLARCGVRRAIRREVLEPFLAGVIAEDDGSTSTAFTRLVVRSFVLGTPGVPAAGMGAFPAQLAAHLPDVELGVRVERVEAAAGGHRVRTGAGDRTARAVVVATDPRTAAALVPVPAPRMKGLVTHWYATDEAPSDLAATAVDGRRRGPVVNAAVMTATAPGYAPGGQHLVQATCLLRPGEEPAEADVRRHVGEIYGVSTARWREVTRTAVPDALPAQPAPVRIRQEVDLGDGLFVCGDHRDTASQQGAMVSGRRTATAVRRWLAGAR